MAGLGGWMDGCRYVYMCMCGWLGYGCMMCMYVGMYTCVCVDGYVRWMDGMCGWM